jgi:hypothetical protein
MFTLGKVLGDASVRNFDVSSLVEVMVSLFILSTIVKK